ncbi:regulator of Vps4 activity in the MVB pathway protein [Tasmannia lanceolata]|uniref:regulator of Vps4 activity in the MVB pathway protein n=1 Tax=Tasmannia lanceolata TaxID=3420 RepID=UPI004062C083
MTLLSEAVLTPCKKLVRFGATMFGRSFNSSKCKTVARLATSRIKLLRNKREMQVKQMRRDIAMLLQSGQDATARIRVEHVMREQNIMEATEIIELFCELVVVRLPIIAKQRGCPADLKEGISSLIFAAPRCSDIPELQQIRNIFEKKYGKDFVSAATELRPDCGVNRTLIEKLSVRTPTGEVKLKLMKEIAKEYQIEWDTKESELELLKPPEENLEGPCTFVSATSMPVKSMSLPDVGPNGSNNRFSNNREINVKSMPFPDVGPNGSNNRSSNNGEINVMHFKDTASAAQAAAESAEKAVAAAQAAAYLANQNPNRFSQESGFRTVIGNFSDPTIPSNKNVSGTRTINSTQSFGSNDPQVFRSVENFHKRGDNQSKRWHYMSEEEMGDTNLDGKKTYRRHSYNAPKVHSDVNFDDSDGLDSECDEEIEMEMPVGGIYLPPNRPPPPLPSSYHTNKPEERTSWDSSGSHKQNTISHVHPKLPDYDAISARFEALKFPRS